MNYHSKPKPGNMKVCCRVCFKTLKDFEYFNNHDLCSKCAREAKPVIATANKMEQEAKTKPYMSHVKAVRCNCCGHIRSQDETVGILATEDLYSKLKSFPTVFTESLIQRTHVHYCTRCYYNKVTRLVNIDKGSDPEGYENEVAERAYMLRRQCVLHPVNKPIDE